jgi:hypothetical protein
MNRSCFSIALLGFLCPKIAEAGMPTMTVRLTDMAEIRLQNISFFLAGFLLSAYLIKSLWNYLHKEWPVLPRLSYGRALGVTAVWGLVFVLVLTMISGARELMTPAAWEKDGRTFKVVQDKPSVEIGPSEDARRHKLEELRFALWDYAQSHDGQFPIARESSAFAADLWQTPHALPFHYLYAGNLTRKGPNRPLAWEPEVFGQKRLMLYTNGLIQSMTNDEIERAVSEAKR